VSSDRVTLPGSYFVALTFTGTASGSVEPLHGCGRIEQRCATNVESGVEHRGENLIVRCLHDHRRDPGVGILTRQSIQEERCAGCVPRGTDDSLRARDRKAAHVREKILRISERPEVRVRDLLPALIHA